jgi:Linalool dehydratase/isomerase
MNTSAITFEDMTFGSGEASKPLKSRALKVYAVMFAIGLLPQLFMMDAVWRTAGLGLMFPGGGFLTLGGWGLVMFAINLVLMLAACAVWQLMANAVAPLFIWVGSLLLAMAIAPADVGAFPVLLVIGAVAGFTLLVRYLSDKTLREEQARLHTRNQYLPQAIADLRENAVPAPVAGTRETTLEELKALRYCLDRGMQPVNDFNGFDLIEQFQTSAIRYQLNYLLWALQVYQCHYTPNFHGYLNQAQCNLIDKITVPVVWKWWRWESMLGAFSFDFDPIAKDNIMFGGFTSVNIAMYTANTGDDRYLQPGALRFEENPNQAYEHDLESILAAGRMNHKTACYGPLYPCEPRLTYSLCNIWGNLAHLTADRIFDTQYSPQMAASLKPLQMSEMMGIDGSPHSGRVNTLGIRMPVYTCNFVSAQWGWMATPLYPDLSERTWAVLKQETVDLDSNGDVRLDTMAYDRVDTGNYRKGESGVHGQYLVLAQEMGDREVAEAIIRKFDKDFGRVESNGVVAYTKASNLNNAVSVLGKLTRTGDIRKCVNEGPGENCLKGPVLDTVSYPEVLVAKAYSSDGAGLELVVYPGTSQTRQTLAISRLQPNAVYAVSIGSEQSRLTTTANGTAELNCVMDGRTEIHITPESH